jgi:hypothetical protein
MLEAGEQLNTYFDGTSAADAGYSLYWVGPPNASISRQDWTGNTRIDHNYNYRPFLYVDQGEEPDITLTVEVGRKIDMQFQLADYDRTLHQVTCTAGPSVIRNYDLDVGAAIEVDFTLTAGVPRPFSTYAREVAFSHDATSAQWSDEVVNLVTNASAEVSTSGWTAIPGTSGVAALTSVTSTTEYGSKVLRCTWSTASTAAGGGSSTDVAVVAGQTYSFVVNHIKSSITNRLQLQVEWRTSSTTVSTVTGTAFVSSAGVEGSATLNDQVAPATATVARIKVVSVTGTSYANWSIGSYLELDGVIANYGSTVQFFDGYTANTSAYDYSWDGTVGLSTSRRTFHVVDALSELIDPDLPALASPPTPPAIPDLAIVDQNEWTRYYVEIPGEFVSLWSETVPTLQLLTQDDEVRQLRVRFYANPFGWDATAVDPTGYCGEFLLSYLPANSTLTVDGVSQAAYAQVSGSMPIPANQLLYGSDGSPMDWPSLSCGVDYIMTVDILPTEDVDNLTIAVFLNNRE